MADTYQTLDGVRTNPELDKLIKRRDNLIGYSNSIRSKSNLDKADENNWNSAQTQIADLESQISSITKKLKANQQSALAPGLTTQTQGSALMGGSTNQSVLTPLG